MHAVHAVHAVQGGVGLPARARPTTAPPSSHRMAAQQGAEKGGNNARRRASQCQEKSIVTEPGQQQHQGISGWCVQSTQTTQWLISTHPLLLGPCPA